MLSLAVVYLLLELLRYNLEVAVLYSAMLEVSYQSNEESLVEDPILLVALDVECRARVDRLWRGRVCRCGLVSLLEYDYGLEFLVQRPENLFESINDLVIDQVLELPQDFEPELALNELLERCRHLPHLCLLLRLDLGRWVDDVISDYFDLFVNLIQTRP